MDKQQLSPGDSWEREILTHIRQTVRLFIPVLSANTERAEEGYVFREWDEAATRSRSIPLAVGSSFPPSLTTTTTATPKSTARCRRSSSARTSVTHPVANRTPACWRRSRRRSGQCGARMRHDHRHGGRPARRGEPWPGLDAFEENAHATSTDVTPNPPHCCAACSTRPSRALRPLGSGKDLLLRAALFPALRRRTSCRSTCVWTSSPMHRRSSSNCRSCIRRR